MNTIRIVVVGDGDTGKTCMLIAYKDRKFDDTYIPTVFDSYSMTVPINSQNYTVILSDTAGQEDYDKLRKFAYNDADAFILCYSVADKSSYANVYEKWAPELRRNAPKAKIILAGTKCDLRNTSEKMITNVEGIKLSQLIRSDFFVETSAKKMFNIDKVFNSTMALVERSKSRSRKKEACTLL